MYIYIYRCMNIYVCMICLYPFKSDKIWNKQIRNQSWNILRTSFSSCLSSTSAHHGSGSTHHLWCMCISRKANGTELFFLPQAVENLSLKSTKKTTKNCTFNRRIIYQDPIGPEDKRKNNEKQQTTAPFIY